MLSASKNPAVVEEYLAKELTYGRVIQVDPRKMDIHINRFGVIPKGHQASTWRLIVDMSHPKGHSVNDGIDPALCSLSYTTVEMAAQRVLSLGKGTLLAKLDLKSAYRMVPVHPDDRHLLGMEWQGKVLVDTALPFGLRSAPKVFNVLADCLQWIFQHSGIKHVLHYLDDYLLAGKPESGECGEGLQRALALCEELGAQVSREKLEGPGTSIVFLGIILDTTNLELRLPDDKLQRLRQLIQVWKGKRSCTKRDLLSLIGQLQHACKVVRPGRTFLRRMIELATVAKELHHHIRLNRGFKSDLEWWGLFLPTWNGITMMSSVCRTQPMTTVTSDASGGWGCGAFSSDGQWFQCRWPGSWDSVHITVKELLPIVVAIALWGHEWQGRTIRCRSDNAAVVSIINSGRSKDQLAMHLMRSLFFFTAKRGCILQAVHVEGRLNIAADALSRGNLALFHHQVPDACQNPTPIPKELVQLLLVQRPDWTSENWRRLFSSTLQRVSPNPHSAPTEVEKIVT